MNTIHPALFIAAVILFTSFGALANPAWGSLLSDLVPQEHRGSYFGWRSRNLGVAAVISSAAAGMILHHLKQWNIFSGFFLIFLIAFAARVISWAYLKDMQEPPLKTGEPLKSGFFSFIRNFKQDNFARFVIFAALMSFSVNLASPFFAVFMLRDLKFSYWLYGLINVVATLTVFLVISRWGRHADKTGNLKLIKLTAPMIGAIPLFWIVNQNPVYLVLAQIFSGFAWAGFNLSSTNLFMILCRRNKGRGALPISMSSTGPLFRPGPWPAGF
jgi:MFS family permease